MIHKPDCDGLSPNAWVVFVSPDMIGLWRLRKSLALDDARWYFDAGRKAECSQILLSARSCHHEIMRIRFHLRGRRQIPEAARISRVIEFQPKPEPIPAPPSKEPRLQPREYQVAKLVALGMSNPQIAAEIRSNTGNVSVYVCNARRKLGATSRKELGEFVANLERNQAAA